MPPRKQRGAAAVVAAQPFDGLVVALNGVFPGKTHAALTKYIEGLGGQVSKAVTPGSTTHLISVDSAATRRNAKFADAQAQGIPIVTLDWAEQCEQDQALAPTAAYEFGTSSSAAAAAAAADTTASNGTAKSTATAAANDKNGKNDNDDDDDDDDNAVAITTDTAAAAAPAATTRTSARTRTRGAVPTPAPAAPTTTTTTTTKKTAKSKSEPPASPDPKKRKTNDSTTVGETDDKKQPKGKKVKAKIEDDVSADTKVDDKPVPEVLAGQTVKSKDTLIPIDTMCYSHSSTYTVHVDDDGLIWDASLNQANRDRNNNKFYIAQVIVDPKTKDYRTWTRWGRVGDFGQSATLGDGSLDSALKEFNKKFKDKTGLKWEDRNLPAKPNKYAFVEKSYDSDSEDDGDAAKTAVKDALKDDEVAAEPVCTLEKPIQDLMELIFNKTIINATMSSFSYDAQKLPLGKLSKQTILRGFQALKDLSAVIDNPAGVQEAYGMSYNDALDHFSNLFYSYIPHVFGRNRPPTISSSQSLKIEIDLLESLSDLKVASEIMKTEKSTGADAVHPLDTQFRCLNLKEMTVLDHSGQEFIQLTEYLNVSRGKTHHIRYDVGQIFRIERTGEHDRFNNSKFASIKSDRRLLWHGSRCTNFGGILSQGLRIAPPEAPVSGYMFGKGIYLADMSSKSGGYCASNISDGHALLLLCEAELGDPMYKLTRASGSAGTDAQKDGMVSVLGQGRTGPALWKDAGCIHPSLAGVKIPDAKEEPSATNVANASLYYNEYICYDVAQVRLRYLLRVKMIYDP